jgi:phage-related protein
MSVPSSHIVDSLRLDADGKIHLYELNPSVGSGQIRFKADNDVTWLSHLFTGIPVMIDGETFSAQGTSPQPTMVIGNVDIDLSAFKPLIWSGGLDNARIVRYKVLLDDLVNNRDIKETNYFRVKRVDSYSTSQIKLILSVFSPTGPSTLPFRQYVPPQFPFVVL